MSKSSNVWANRREHGAKLSVRQVSHVLGSLAGSCREFINVTVNIQINDIRQLPIIIPNQAVLEKIKLLFDEIVELKKQNYNDKINDIEMKINNIVNILYGI